MKIPQKRHIAIIILAVLGGTALLYPTVSSRWNAWRQGKLTSSYEEGVQKIDSSRLDEIYTKAKAYNKGLVGADVPDVFIRMENTDDKVYDKLLNPNGDGIMGSVEIPAIKINLPIFHSTSDRVLEKGAGHLPGSSLPVGGRGSHTVISAHRGLPNASMFTDLDRIKEGHIFYLRVLGKILAYEVDRIQVVEPDITESLAINGEKDLATLVTCTPYGVNTKRLLVRGHRVPYVEKTYKEQAAHRAAPSAHSLLMRLICVLMGLILGGMAVLLPSHICKKLQIPRKG